MPYDSQVLWTNAATGSIGPLSGIVRIYTDGTNGNDTNGGTSLADAFRTFGRAQLEIDRILAQHPSQLDVISYIFNQFAAEDLISNLVPQGRTRVYWVCPVSAWFVAKTTTVAAVGAAPVAMHDLENITLNGVVLDGSEVGMTLRLTDATNPNNFTTCTILRVNVPNQIVWVTQLSGEFPGWLAINSIAEVLLPGVDIQGTASVSADLAQIPDQIVGTAVAEPLCWLIGVRAKGLTISGRRVGVAGCWIRSGATWGNIQVSGGGHSVCYFRSTGAGFTRRMPDVLAQEFGLWGGTPPTNATLGNGSGSLSFLASFNDFCGYLDGNAGSLGAANAVRRACLRGATCTVGAVQVSNALITGQAAISSTFTGWIQGTRLTIDSAVAGTTYFQAFRGGSLEIDMATVESVGAPSRYAYVAAEEGKIIVASSAAGLAVHNCPATISQIYVDKSSEVTVAIPEIRVGAVPGAATSADIYVEGQFSSRILTKTALNGGVNACPFVEVLGGTFKSDDLSLPAGTGNYQTDYGARGAIHIADNGNANVEKVTGGVGGTIGTGCFVKRRSSLIWTTGGGGLIGAAAIQIGGSPAGAWADGAYTTDDGVVGGELCAAGARAVP